MGNKYILTDEDLEVIDHCLEQADAWNLQVEVIAWALKGLKEDPNLTPAEAMLERFNEWVK